MPQVAARINAEQERWLKDYFRTKSAGAEFILPWAVDTFFRAINIIKHKFNAAELKTIIEAHRGKKLLPEHMRVTYLQLRVNDAYEMNNVHEKFGVNKATIDNKLKTLDDTMATALMVWASAFWVSRQCSAENLEEYISSY
jgi:hypothetical protein